MKNCKQIIHDPQKLQPTQRLIFYTPIVVLFVSLFIITNIVAQKIVPIGGGIILTAGDFIYPLNYILSIVLVEVYGYAMSRRAIWSAFICNIIVALIIGFCILLPHDASWPHQTQYAMILGRAPRILIASLSAFFVGEFLGTYLLAKIKILTSGKHLWFRAITATLIGQSIDSLIFTTIAFVGILNWQQVIILSIGAYLLKIIVQTLLTPGIYIVAKLLKNKEKVDIFDHHTDFNPFNLRLK